MYAEKYGLYSLPGGGVEENESITDVLERVLLVSFEKLVALISEFQPKTRQQIYLQARDLAALEAYKKD